jgi:hypothetical protein
VCPFVCVCVYVSRQVLKMFRTKIDKGLTEEEVRCNQSWVHGSGAGRQTHVIIASPGEEGGEGGRM